MQNKIKNFIKKDLPVMAHDPRFVGLMIFLVMILLLSWSGIKVIRSNYDLQKQISEITQKNSVAELQNKNLALQNEYYNTDQYLELAARQNFGLAAPGEKELIVPKDVALRYAAELPANQDPAAAKQEKVPFIIRNLREWRDFFFGPSQANTLTKDSSSS